MIASHERSIAILLPGGSQAHNTNASETHGPLKLDPFLGQLFLRMNLV